MTRLPGVSRFDSRSLGVRIVLLLSVALLPVGLIALYQTREVALHAARRTELALQALTERAARHERAILQESIGAVDVLNASFDFVRDDPAACTAMMRRLVQDNERFSFAGIVKPDRSMECSSLGRPVVLDPSSGNPAFWADPVRTIIVTPNAPFSKEPVVNITDPLWRDGELAGALSLSIPHRVLQRPPEEPPADDRDPLALLTFNEKGEVLTASGGLENAAQLLPRDRALAALTGERAVAFSGTNRAGQPRVFAVVPILPGAVYAMGTYDMPAVEVGTGVLRLPAWLFPILMWLVSLVVAYVAMDRLVIRNIRNLQRQMRAFAQSRKLPEPRAMADKPRELQDIEASFLIMTETLLQDEALLEDAVHEKNVLLKEVHHRVKNNLQLISSIMNMKMRRAANPETVDMLQRLQARIMGLARIHRSLYQSQNQGLVDVGVLLGEIVDQTLAMGGEIGGDVRIDRHIDPIMLYPDQAVPLTLLASEAATNVLKNIGAPPGGQRWIRVRLFNEEDDGRACMEFSNSVAEDSDVADDVPGLGSQLIRAFASQLGGDLTIERKEGAYILAIRFPIAAFSPDPVDY